MASTEEFAQLSLAFVDEIQRRYEAIRPIVLLKNMSASQRSEQTGIACRTLQRYVGQFDSEGMLGLIDKRTAYKGIPQIPPQVQAHVLVLKDLYPPLSDNEIAHIVQNTLDYRLDNKGVRRILTSKELPPGHPRPEYLRYHDYEDPYQARVEVVRLHRQGWTKDSIAGFMGIARKTVHQILDHFKAHDFAGLLDDSRAPDHPPKKLTLPIMAQTLELQRAHPDLGSFRIAGLLELDGIDLSPRTIRRAMALNRVAYHLPPTVRRRPRKYEDVVKDMPYVPTYRHQYWFMDIRYIVQLEEQWIYSILLLEGYSRKILAGGISYTKDLVAVLAVVYSAMQARGLPETMVTNGESVFQANTYIQLCEELDIHRQLIQKGHPWQDLAEPLFGIQRRMEDHQFGLAETFEEVAQKHLEFIELYNTTRHWAHQDRADGRTTPEEVLSWVMGRPISDQELAQVFYERLFVCSLTKGGYARLHNYYFYVEAGLGKRKVQVWVYKDRLRAEYNDVPLARYTCTYNEKSRRIEHLRAPVHFQTPYSSRQLFLFDMQEYWVKISRREPKSRPRRKTHAQATQLSLFEQAA